MITTCLKVHSFPAELKCLKCVDGLRKKRKTTVERLLSERCFFSLILSLYQGQIPRASPLYGFMILLTIGPSYICVLINLNASQHDTASLQLCVIWLMDSNRNISVMCVWWSVLFVYTLLRVFQMLFFCWPAQIQFIFVCFENVKDAPDTAHFPLHAGSV